MKNYTKAATVRSASQECNVIGRMSDVL